MRIPRPWQRRPRRVVSIDPVQLDVVHFLLRFGAGTMDDLFEEASSARTLPREMFDTAMADAAAQDIVDYRFDPEAGTTSLVLTDMGRRLQGKLPESTRSRLDVYL